MAGRARPCESGLREPVMPLTPLSCLPDDLLQSIVSLLSTFRDLLAFGVTCRAWRDFSAHTSFLYPLLLHPRTDSQRFPRLLSLSDLRSMTFLRCSYGHLIFCDDKGLRFYIVNAFTGAKVVPPCLKSDHFTRISYATLTGPVASTDSHLLVGSGAYLFQWRIGSNSWSEHCPKVCLLSIEQNVAFKGKTYALGPFGSFYIIEFSPTLLIQKFEIVFEEDGNKDLCWENEKAWLVVCGEALLLIKLVEAGRRRSSEAFLFMAFKLESLDAVNKKARWVKVGWLHNWAIFVSADGRCEALSFKNPKRWGGRSNHIYFPSYQTQRPWGAVKLWRKWNNPPSTCLWLSFSKTGSRYRRLGSTWVFPGAFPRFGQQGSYIHHG